MWQAEHLHSGCRLRLWETWINQKLRTAEARKLAELAIRGLYGEEAIEISLLDVLQAISGVGGDFNTMIGSAQSLRFVGGPQQLSKKLAARLGRAVRFGVAIRAVDQGSRVVLSIDTESLHVRRAPWTRSAMSTWRGRSSRSLPGSARRADRRVALRELRRLAAVAGIHGRRDLFRRGRRGGRTGVAVAASPSMIAGKRRRSAFCDGDPRSARSSQSPRLRRTCQ